LTLSIEYKLTGPGWAECTIANADQTCTLTASYLSDAFGNLVLSAVAMLNWFKAVSFSFEEEPGEYKWDLECRPNNTLDLRISEAYLNHSVDPSIWEYKLLFQTTSTQMQFGKAVAVAAKALLDEYGEAGYLEKWIEYPFPTESLRQLNEKVAYYSQFPHIFPDDQTL